MSKRTFKVQASSERAASSGQFGNGFGTGSFTPSFGRSSTLSYLVEPPDLSKISDPNVTVLLKNVNKRDPTTKVKALEDLQTHVQSIKAEGKRLEDGVLLDVWIQLYPRLSIDTERRVRQLAHNVLGQIAALSGKQLARHMPSIVGPWLAGMYDNDRIVRKAAQDAFEQTFLLEEKLREVWRVYQRSILDHAKDCILRETVTTLSDERTVSQDDADAKYARVVATGISLLLGCLDYVPADSLNKGRDILDEIIHDKKLWEFASHPDAAVRRSTFRLLNYFLEHRRDMVPSLLPIVSPTIFSTALLSKQTGSALESSEAISLLTTQFPEAWTNLKKKPKISLVIEYLKRGSQGGPPEVWSHIATFLIHLPEAIFPPTLEDSVRLLQALQDGIRRKEEPKTNLPVAWSCYCQVTSRLLNRLPTEPNQRKLVETALFPLFQQFIRPQASSEWSSGPVQLSTCMSAMEVIHNLQWHVISHSFDAEWLKITRLVLDKITAPAPEQAEEPDRRQEEVMAEGTRWVHLCSGIRQISREYVPIISIVENSVGLMLDNVLRVLRRGTGNHYGAASVLELVIRDLAECIIADQCAVEEISSFFKEDLPSLALARHLPSLLRSLESFAKPLKKDGSADPEWDRRATFAKAVRKRTMTAILALSDEEQKVQALQNIMAAMKSAGDDAENDLRIEIFVRQSFEAAMRGSTTHWKIVSEALGQREKVISQGLQSRILWRVLEGLSDELQSAAAKEGFTLLSQQNPEMITKRLSQDGRYFGSILRMIQSDDEQVVANGEELRSLVESTLRAGDGEAYDQVVGVLIEECLMDPTPDSVSVENLFECVEKALRDNVLEKRELVEGMLPNVGEWSSSLDIFLSAPPNPSLAITDKMGSSVYLLTREAAARPAKKPYYDRSGYSLPLRAGIFFVRLLAIPGVDEIFHSFAPHDDPEDSRSAKAVLVSSFLLTMQLANDSLGVRSSMSLWRGSSAETERAIIDLISDGQRLLMRWLQQRPANVSAASQPHFLSDVQQQFQKAAKGTTPSAFYNARALAHLRAESLELHGSQMIDSQAVHEALKALPKASEVDVFRYIANLAGFSESESMMKDAIRACNEIISDLTGKQWSGDTNEGLRLLILLNSTLQWDGVGSKIPQHRLVLFVKNILSWPDDGLLDFPFATAEVARVLCAVLPLISSVYGSHWQSTLDLIQRVWTELPQGGELSDHLPVVHATLKLFAVLKKLHTENDDADEAWAASVPILDRSLVGLLELAPNVYDDSHQPLKIINELLARHIIQVPLQHVGGIRDSYKVKTDYISQLVEGKHVPSFLDCIASLFYHDRGNKTIDASRFDIISFSPNTESNPEREAEWLAVHLYYLSLKYLPAVTKAWWIDSPRRQMAQAIESWTEKYISPIVVSEELDKVSEWAEEQADDDDEENKNLKIKVSKKAKEVTAGYEVDEQMMQIVIKLPGAYPLRQAIVEGPNRVGVDAKKWRSWLLSAQGVITFSVSTFK
ncbi:MAG: hypothetical protein M1823_005635 [Watsoniomyces obsoletus]|nr:MAG: hypothetical protein M1823_005635 [Watsoniomyces obsoletus]